MKGVKSAMEKIKKAEDLRTQGLFKQCIKYAREGLSVAEEMGRKEEIAKACEVLCDSYYEVKEYEESIGFGKRSLDIAKTVGDKQQQALLYFNLAWSYYDAGDYKQSQEYGKQAVSIAKELENKELEAKACHVLAWSYKEVVDYERSKKYGKQSLSFAKEVRNEKLEAKAFHFLAWLYYAMTEYKDSKDYGEQSLSIAKKIRERELEAEACQVLAWSCHKSGDYEESKEYGNQFLNIAVELGNKELEAKACHVLNWSYHMVGDGLMSPAEKVENGELTAKTFQYSRKLSHDATQEYKQSQSYSKRSLRIALVVGNRELLAEALCALAWSLYRVRKFTDSIKYCKHLLEMAKEVQNRELEAEACFLLGWSYRLTYSVLQSVEYSKQSWKIAEAVGNKELEKEARDLSSAMINTVTTCDYDSFDETEMSQEVSVPGKIKARGPRAKLAYKNAFKTGKVKVYRARIMPIGQDRAGKTSLKKPFLGLPFNPEEENTDGIEVDPSKCEVDIDQVKNWKSTDEKLGVSQFSSNLVKRVARDLQELDDEAEEEGNVAKNDEENEIEEKREIRLGQIKPFQLTDSNFDAMISYGTTFVKFYAPWCRHCRELAPVWDQLANKCADSLSGPRIAKVDCTTEEELCSSMGIKGYPTLILFSKGVQKQEYTGPRDLDSLYKFAMQHHDEL